jgi:hypothetical protein
MFLLVILAVRPAKIRSWPDSLEAPVLERLYISLLMIVLIVSSGAFSFRAVSVSVDDQSQAGSGDCNLATVTSSVRKNLAGDDRWGLIEAGLGSIPPITYYWTVPLILDHSYLVGKLKSSKIADTKVSGF